MVTANHVLNVEHVTKRFDGLVAVNNVSFDVQQNEILGIIGPNGSGKTTMMNLISGALKLSEGNIALMGHYIAGMPAAKINQRGIARTFQLVRVLKTLNVEENCIAGMVFGHRRFWGQQARYKAHKLLDLVGLQDKRKTPVEALTYIDQKRLELTRALASEPKIILLDEWLAGLNPTELQTGIELIEKIHNQGCTIILVEHVMDAIRSLCNRCVVMSTGSVIDVGTPEQVLSNPEVIKVYLGEDT